MKKNKKFQGTQERNLLLYLKNHRNNYYFILETYIITFGEKLSLIGITKKGKSDEYDRRAGS